MSKVNELEILEKLNLFDIKIKNQAPGKVQTINDQWLIDYATTGYLGLDRDIRMHNKGIELSSAWGTITNWSRMEVNPDIYDELENKISKWLKCKNVVIGHTITINSFSVMPYIAKDGYIICDDLVHSVVWEACRLARDHGSQILKFKHQDIDSLEEVLKKLPIEKRKIITVDGVYSISTEVAPIKKMLDLCAKYNAYLFIDDAHGLGVMGENPCAENPYGQKGNGIVNFSGENYDRVFYVSNFGKALGATVAFLCYPDEFKETLRANTLQYLFSAPPNPYSIGTALASLEINEEEGDQRRLDLYERVKFFTDSLIKNDISFSNQNFHPVVYIKIGRIDQMSKVARFLLDNGVIAGYRAYPVVAQDSCGMRFSITCDHTIDMLDETVNLMKEALLLK